jgi:hypothetical protein
MNLRDTTYPASRYRLVRYLASGGAVRREDNGGNVGTLWYRVSRTGQRYDKIAGDRLMKRGFFILHGVKYVLTKDYADAWSAERIETEDAVRPVPRTGRARQVA